jgi:hypothetical protein
MEEAVVLSSYSASRVRLPRKAAANGRRGRKLV